MYIKNLERSLGQDVYLKPNKMGYTSDLNEAGIYDAEDVINICRDANVLGVVSDIAMTEEDIVYGYENNININKEYKKRNIDDVMSDITKQTYFNENPISHVMGTLIDNEYYPTEEFDNLRSIGKPMSYNETFEKNIEIYGEKGLFVKMSIYRNEIGRYELTSYKNTEIKNKKKKNFNVKPA
jgi:hypothetical protein